MTLPDGKSCFDRVVMNVDVPLEFALEREFSGYGVVVPQAGLLGDPDGSGLIEFENGVPVGVRHTGSGRTGGEALADLAGTGPYRVRLVAADSVDALEPTGSISPAAPAVRLAGDEELGRRTREKAGYPAEHEPADELDAVAAFLADEEKIQAIRDRAAAEARRRASEWGFETVESAEASDEPKRQENAR
ncbi:MAG: hypothetical protein ABEJ58_11090 [Halodesulfurarchaeum sp.]